jgi:bifunctional DNase/RNase
MTHDLIKNLLGELAVEVERIVVTELRESTFFAEILLKTNGQTLTVSSRPSDAIALAVRLSGTKIFAEESVLDEAGYTGSEENQDQEQEEVVEEFREFLDKVNPEDFAS